MKIGFQTTAAIVACFLAVLASCHGDDPYGDGGAGDGTGGQGGAGGDSTADTDLPAARDVTGRYTSSAFEDPFEALLTQAADGTLSGSVCGPPERPDGPNTNCGPVTDGSVSGDTVRFSYRIPWAMFVAEPIDYSFEGTASQEGSVTRFEGQLRHSEPVGTNGIVWTACPGTGRCP
jgi:hypothetical protein